MRGPTDHLPNYPVAIPDIERQIRWEGKNVEDGVQTYRKAVQKANLIDTPPGMEAARDMLKLLIPAIEAAREEAINGIAKGSRGRNPEWWWTIGFLPADKLAVITARTILTDRGDAVGRGRRMTALANNIGTAIKTEMEFEQWRREERERAKEAKDAGIKDHVNLFEAITSRSKVVDARAFGRWKKKLKSIERLEWTREMKIQVGAKLLDLAIQHGGGWFEYRMIFAMGKTERRIFLSDIAKTAINDINARLEINRPHLLPMITPPKPWRRISDPTL